jgi:ABC-2 type transport system permease protein
VIGRLWRISLQRSMEFRWQFVSRLLNNAAGLFFALVTFEVAYGSRPEIGGWSKHQTVLLVGMFQLYLTLFRVFLLPNIGEMTRVIYGGELDKLLLKPVSAQVLLSFRNVRVTAGLNSILGLSVIVYALVKLGHVPGPLAVLAAGALLLSGLAIVYSLWFISMTLEFWFSGLWSWSNFVPNVFSFAMYPEGVYKGAVRWMFLTVAPVIVIVNVPTKVLLGDAAWGLGLYSLGLAALLVLLSHLQWRFALRRYTSASS